jgi:hypothetical protein
MAGIPWLRTRYVHIRDNLRRHTMKAALMRFDSQTWLQNILHDYQ